MQDDSLGAMVEFQHSTSLAVAEGATSSPRRTIRSSSVSLPTTTATTTTSSQQQDCHAKIRPRSFSVAGAMPSVETVIVKAKRAASSLWMLLHAQNCADDNCAHAGCMEAKRLHVHLQTCTSEEGCECLVACHGCDQARKLLAHYRRCKSQRARHSGQQQLYNGASSSSSSSRREAVPQCLVCSLVARQARSMLERGSALNMARSLSPKQFNVAKHRIHGSHPASSILLDTVDTSDFGDLVMPPPLSRAHHGPDSMKGLSLVAATVVSNTQFGGGGNNREYSQGNTFPMDNTRPDVRGHDTDSKLKSPGRGRSQSTAENFNQDAASLLLSIRRARSASVGGEPLEVYPCEPIEEEQRETMEVNDQR